MEMMKAVKVDDIVEFHMNDSHLYGVVEKVMISEEEIFLFVRAGSHLYRNVPLENVIHNFGRDE